MKILIIDDDRRIGSFLQRGLTAEGYQVRMEIDGRDGIERVRNEDFDLVILDRLLPYIDGLEVCRALREERRPPSILMLTAKDSLQDKIEGLRGGADDYLTKPFAFDELLARIVALNRRHNGKERSSALNVSGIRLDPDAHSVMRDGSPIELTAREFEVLRYLMANVDRVVSRERLLNSIWTYRYDSGTKIVDVCIRYLRLKLDLPNQPSRIKTVRGIGYMIVS